MIEEKNILAVIPARGGSKGLPGKNVRQLGGKPLIAWTIEAAKSSKYLDRVIVSSDDAEIIKVAGEWGCEAPFVRPAHLANDESIVSETIYHALESMEGTFGYVVLLNPTTPFRSAGDIDGCLEKCQSSGAVSCVSLAPQIKLPSWMFRLDDAGTMSPVMAQVKVAERRQNHPDVWVLNGAVSVWRVDWFMQHRELIPREAIGFTMPAERSVDIDTELDFLLAETIVDSGVLGDKISTERKVR